MKNKIRIFDAYTDFSCYDGFDSIINTLEEAKKLEETGEWEKLRISTHDDSSKWIIEGFRWETDKEYNERMKHLEKTKNLKKKLKADKEERDKKEYERLKKKFGDK
jgi:pyruvate/2-oxoacid:ferredoxin oxidoreductase beta subunit